MPTALKRRQLLAGALALPVVLPCRAEAFEPTAKQIKPFDKRLRPTVYPAGDMPIWSLPERMAHYSVPGVAVAVLRDGHIQSINCHGARTRGQSAAVGPRTMFSVGSVSKVVTAAPCLRLVASGLLDLDRDVNHWLKRWHLPDGPDGDRTAITLRMLLSHTSGFNIHGFADFAPDAPLPSLVEILNGTAPAKNSPLARIDGAGKRARYSGGGLMIVQAVLEDASGMALQTLAERHVFTPLDMRRSTFSASLPPDWGDIARAHDADGRPEALPRGWQSFPELAASGLWSCAADLGRFIAALCDSYRGGADAFLPAHIAADMMTPVSPGVFGLGPRLAGQGSSCIFHHGGANDSYKAYIEGNLASGDGLVVLTNGANGDVLGDEIRNAISDALGWPGDWSEAIQALNDEEPFEAYVGKYRKRANPALEITGVLDTAFDKDMIEIRRTSEGLTLHAGRKAEALASLSPSQFVAPGVYLPASTLKLTFKRDASRSVRVVAVSGGGGSVLFDRAE